MTITMDRPTSNEGDMTFAASQDSGSGSMKRSLARRIFKAGLIGLMALVVALAATIFYSSRATEDDIAARHTQIRTLALSAPSETYDPAITASLPVPVQRYFDYVFVGPQEPLSYVEMTMEGEFRRPLTESFEFTTAEQTIAVGDAALMFSARTTLFPGVWARVYDVYSNGEMEMKAKVLSTLTVVDERESPALNVISLRRWLLESPLYPAALLPGGAVRWEAIDDSHARAIVSADGLEASMVATFRSDGSLESFDTESDGDLTTPYHGSGEHAFRDDYRLVSGVMIPHSFTIARAANGEILPFWSGQITSISYETFG